MYRFLSVALVMLLVASSQDASSQASRGGNDREIIMLVRPEALSLPGHVLDADLEGMPAGVLDPQLRGILNSLGVQRLLRVVRQDLSTVEKDPVVLPTDPSNELYDPRRLIRVRVAGSIELDSAIARLKSVPGVVYAERNETIEHLSTPVEHKSPHRSLFAWSPTARAVSNPFVPNDLSNNWGFYNPSDRSVDVGAPEAWELQTGQSSVRISFLDTGGEPHSDFAGKIVGGYDFINDDSGFGPDAGAKSPAHGMGVAGLAAALTNNATGVAGLCGGDGTGNSGCSILFAKTLGTPSGSQLAWNYLTNQHFAVDALYWSMANGADITSNSWCGNHGQWSTLPYTVHAALRDAFASGVLSTAAMGNSDGSCNQTTPDKPVPPAAYSDVVTSVGATNQAGQRVSIPGFWQSATGPHLDIVAPGLGLPSDSLADETQSFSGTSAATPLVSGAMGLILSDIAQRSLPLYFYDVPEILKLTALDLGQVGPDNEYGHGLVKVDKALELLRAPNVVASGTATPVAGCYSQTSQQPWVFMADFALFLARRCEVRRSITFPTTYTNPPIVWGRPYGTNGGVTPSNPNGQVAWTGVVPGSVTTTGAVLRTYVYERWSLSGTYLGWYPRPPSSAGFSYAVVGVPNQVSIFAEIEGPTWIEPYTNYTWSASFSGGSGPTTWYRRESDGFSDWQLVSDGSSYSGSSFACNGFDLRLDLTGGSGDTIHVDVNPDDPENPCEWYKVAFPLGTDVPTGLSLKQDLRTTLNFPSADRGQLVRTSADEHSVQARSATDLRSEIMRNGVMAIRFSVPRWETSLLSVSAPDRSSSQRNERLTSSHTRSAPEPPKVQVVVYDLSGRIVRMVTDEPLAAGYYRYEWDGTNQQGAAVPPGVYIVVLTSQGKRMTTKLVKTPR